MVSAADNVGRSPACASGRIILMEPTGFKQPNKVQDCNLSSEIKPGAKDAEVPKLFLRKINVGDDVTALAKVTFNKGQAEVEAGEGQAEKFPFTKEANEPAGGGGGWREAQLRQTHSVHIENKALLLQSRIPIANGCKGEKWEGNRPQRPQRRHLPTSHTPRQRPGFPFQAIPERGGDQMLCKGLENSLDPSSLAKFR